MNYKTQVVHVNRLKIAYNPETWKPKQKPENPKSELKEKELGCSRGKRSTNWFPSSAENQTAPGKTRT